MRSQESNTDSTGTRHSPFRRTTRQSCGLEAIKLFKSFDRGDSYVASADLTKQMDRCTINLMGARGDKSQLGKNDGVTSYGTIISISESPVLPGVVWAGTDDGNLQLSRDGGSDLHRSRSKPHQPHRRCADRRQPVLDLADRGVAF